MFGWRTTDAAESSSSGGDGNVNFNLNAAAAAAAEEFDDPSSSARASEEVEAPPTSSTTTGRITRGLFGFVRNIVFRTTTSESPAAARAMMNGESSSSDSGGDNQNAHVNTAGSSSDDTASSFASMSLRSMISITSIAAPHVAKKRVQFSGQVLIRLIPNLDDIGQSKNNCWWQRNDYDTFEHNNTKIEEMMKRNYYGTISLTAGQRSRRSRSRQRRTMLQQQPRRSNSADSQDSNDSSVGDNIDGAGGDDNENDYEDRFEYCTRGLECRTIVSERQRSKSRDDARRALFGGPFGSGAMFDNHDIVADNYSRACFANVQGAYMRGLYDEEVMKEILQNDTEFLIYYHNVMTPPGDTASPRPLLSTTIVIPPPPPPASTTPNSSAVSPAQLQVYRKEREQYMKSRSKRRYRTTSGNTAAAASASSASAKSAERAPSTD